MRVFLDDDLRYRQPDDRTWVRVATAQEAIDLLKTGEVTYLSLDHDLGPEDAGTGYDVLLFLEEQLVAHDRDLWPTQMIRVHSANAVASRRMAQVIDRYTKLDRVGGRFLWRAKPEDP
jgi:hypothetical protein